MYLKVIVREGREVQEKYPAHRPVVNRFDYPDPTSM